jgi:hypothetical protein
MSGIIMHPSQALGIMNPKIELQNPKKPNYYRKFLKKFTKSIRTPLDTLHKPLLKQMRLKKEGAHT